MRSSILFSILGLASAQLVPPAPTKTVSNCPITPTAAASLEAAHKNCGAPDPPQGLLDWLSTHNVSAKAPAIPFFTIPVHFHIISTEASKNIYNDSYYHRQLEVLNEKYNQTVLSFEMASLKHYVDDTSARGVNDTVIDQSRAKYHTGSYAELNLYFLSDWKPTEFLGQPHNPKVPVYGLCNYATEGVTPLDRATDGCVINQIALPGSKTNPEASFGYTAVHEVGHWLGLLHPWGSIGNVGDCVNSAGA